MKERILHLTLKKKWFNLIASGKKKVEYREIKSYWITRLTKSYQELDWNLQQFIPREFDFIIFRNGYQKNAPTLKVEWKGLDIEMPVELFFEDKEIVPCFAIKLGKVKVLR